MELLHPLRLCGSRGLAPGEQYETVGGRWILILDHHQGPHIYAIYKYEKNIPEKMVAALYAAGFVSGGISASFAGGYADRFGRKRACILYCILYSVTCLTMLSDNLVVLFFGRLTGGICTTLLYSVFEAWMISEYHDQGVQGTDLDLSAIFGQMTVLSCVVAIASGIVGDMLVQFAGTRVWPFMAAVACCAASAYLISTIWVSLIIPCSQLSC